jgi:hypothetical protein
MMTVMSMVVLYTELHASLAHRCERRGRATLPPLPLQRHLVEKPAMKVGAAEALLTQKQRRRLSK